MNRRFGIVMQWIGIAVLFSALPVRLGAESPDDVIAGGGSPRMQGVHIYNVAFYGSYYSSVLAMGSETGGYDISAGGSVTTGWTRTRATSSLFVTYTLSYMRDVTFSEFNSLNHAFSLAYTQKIGSNWKFTGSSSAGVMNTNQFLFQPNLFGEVISTATTADELSSALLTNTNFSNTYLASLLTGAPMLESPAREVLFGDRMLNASAQFALAYHRRRLAISLMGGGTRMQTLSTGSPADGTPTYVLPSATAGLAGVSLSYSLSPRTEIGATASTQRTISRFEDSYTSTAAATFGRRMSQRWALQLHGGVGFFTPVRSDEPLATGPQYVLGGGLSYKAHTHSLLFSVDRGIADSYGYGATSNLNVTGGWNWGMRNRGWSLLVNGGYQELHSTSYPTIRAWLMNAGVSEPLSRSTLLSVTYAYTSHVSYPGLPETGDIHAVRMAFSWMPAMITGN